MKPCFTVIATMRDLKRKDKLLEAAGDTYPNTLSLAVLDVCSDESVKECINGIKDRHVDVLSELNTPSSCFYARFSAQSSFLPCPEQSITQVLAWWAQWRASPSKTWRKCLRPTSSGWSAWSRRWCLTWRNGEEVTSSWSAVWWGYKVSRGRCLRGAMEVWGSGRETVDRWMTDTPAWMMDAGDRDRQRNECVKERVWRGPPKPETCALFRRCGVQRRVRSLQVCHGRFLREFGCAALQV